MVLDRALRAVCCFLIAVAGLIGQDDPAPKSDAERGVLAYEAKDYPSAIAHFERALLAAPDSTVLRANLARALHANTTAEIAAGRLVPAKQAIERALALDATEPAFDVRLAEIERRRDEWPAARRALEAGLARHPQAASIHEAYADLEYAEERLREALQRIERAIALSDPAPARLMAFRDKVARELELEKGWFTDARGQFIVKYDDAAFRDVGGAVLAFVDRAYQDIALRLDHWPKHRVNVILYAKQDFHAVTGTHGWAGGVYDGKIRLPVRNFQTAAAAIERTIRHELLHWFLRDLCPRCPLWLNEGLAQMVEGAPLAPGDRARLVALRDAGRLPKIESLPPSWAGISDAEKVRQLYAQAHAMTAWLEARLGRHGMQDLLRALQRGESVAAAVKAITGEELEALEASFAASL